MHWWNESELEFNEVGELWEKSRPDRLTEHDLLAALLAAYWRGQLPLCMPGKAALIERRELLRLMRDVMTPTSCSLVFTTGDDDVPPARQQLRGGIEIIDLRPRIVLPADPATWTEQQLEAAYEVAAGCKVGNYPLEFWPLVLLLMIRKDDFAVLCDVRDWPRPSFWFRTPFPGHARQATSSAVVRCRRWLQEQAARQPDPIHTKLSMRDGALRRFPQLSKRSFDRIWDEVVPAAWKQAGRRPERLRLQPTI